MQIMSSVSICSLLNADEERIRNELKADAIVDKNRRQSVVRLDETISHILCAITPLTPTTPAVRLLPTV